MTVLRAAGITVERNGRLLVDGVDVVLPAGRTTALLGPNGAGKSTLLRSLAGVERPTSGESCADGKGLLRLHRRERARLVALVEQDIHSDVDLTVRDVVALGRVPHEAAFGADADGDEAVDRALDRAGIAPFQHRAFATLSGGERQRVSLARALAQATPVLLLDEPTNHLDIAAQLGTLRLLAELAAEGTTVVAAMHDLGLAATWADQVVVLERGRLAAAGPTADVLTPDLIARVYGVRATVIENPTNGERVLAFDSLRPSPSERTTERTTERTAERPAERTADRTAR